MKADDNNLDFMLPIPDQGGGQTHKSEDAAAELIRQKVRRAYGDEPDAATEALDVAEAGTGKSKHQKFIYDLTTSGRSLAQIQTAWHEYYAALPDNQKHQVWEEFYEIHAKASKLGAAAPDLAPKVDAAKLADGPPIVKQRRKSGGRVSRTVADLRSQAQARVSGRTKLKPAQHAQSILFGLTVGAVVVLIFLFGFFNERFIAPFIQPSRNISNTPIISSDVASGNDPEIIIPKINVEIPVVYGVETVNEDQVNRALEDGVVHYADTATPGQNGNVVIVGHSSNNIFNKGKYKFAFALLGRLENGDTFYLDKDGKRYTYLVYEKKVVKPTDVSVLSARDKTATVTLITCDPPGTTLNRLVVVAEQMSPDPASNLAADSTDPVVGKATTIPGNAPSLWSRLVNWMF